MSSKVSVWNIVVQHFNTFKNENDKRSNIDWLIMVGLPCVFSLSVVSGGLGVATDFYSNIVTAGSIFTGLLLNLLILVYDQKTTILEQKVKGDDPRYTKYALRKRIISEVHFNISYCILICLISIVISVTASSLVDGLAVKIVVSGFDLSPWVIDFPLMFLAMHIVLTLLMILKRVHQLISSH
jgi:hypothetical protein